MDHVERRVPSSAHSVDLELAEGEKAGDQGIIFGYASDETPQLL